MQASSQYSNSLHEWWTVANINGYPHILSSRKTEGIVMIMII